MTRPLVSVLLPVYNGSRYLKEAVDSILQQTYAHFELIIVDDGSTDATAEIIASYADPRIRYFEQENLGLSATLNRAIFLARGQYLARQDSDDMSFPERFAKQVEFLDGNPACGMVGTWAEIWRERQQTKRAHRHPSANRVLQFELLFNNPFVHSSVMMRREAVESVGSYVSDRSRQLPEDYELWSRISRQYQVANIPEILQVYRETGDSICRQNWGRLMDEVVTLSAYNISLAAGLPRDDINVGDLAALTNVLFRRISASPDLAQLRRIFLRAVEKLRKAGPDDPRPLDQAVRLKWRWIRFMYCRFWVSSKIMRPLKRLGVLT